MTKRASPLMKIGDFSWPVSVRADAECELPVYAVTKHEGMVPSAEYFKKQVHSRSLEGYKVVERGQFGYATIHLDEGSIGVLDTAEQCIISPMYTVFEVDENRVHAPYLLRVLKSPWALSHYATMGSGSVHRRRSISFETLSRLSVPLPDLMEQRSIAVMFGTLDSQTHAQVSFGDIADLDAPMVDPTSDEYADLLHVGPDRIEKGNGQLLECETAREEGLISKKFIFDERYVLYSKIRPALKKCTLAEFRGLCSADMYPVRPVEGQVTREFIWGLLLSDAFDRYIVTLPDRANIPKLNRTELNAFQFRLPPINLQNKYSAIVSSTIKLKRRYQKFLAEADSLPASFQFFI